MLTSLYRFRVKKNKYSTSKPTPPYLRPTKKRCSRRHLFPSRLSDAEIGTGEESDISNYTSSKPRHISKPRPTSSHLTSLEGDTSDDGATVIYKRQSWKGKIIQEKEVKQGRGRPHKENLVQWEQSWIDRGCFTTPKMLQSWTERKASK